MACPAGTNLIQLANPQGAPFQARIRIKISALLCKARIVRITAQGPFGGTCIFATATTASAAPTASAAAAATTTGQTQDHRQDYNHEPHPSYLLHCSPPLFLTNSSGPNPTLALPSYPLGSRNDFPLRPPEPKYFRPHSIVRSEQFSLMRLDRMPDSLSNRFLLARSKPTELADNMIVYIIARNSLSRISVK
jgi:hypothetical protein